MTVLYGIAIKNAKRAIMREVGRAEITLAAGIVGDCRGHGGLTRARQVTITSLTQWHAACAKLGKDLPWTMRRAGLCVRGFSFGPDDFGAHIYIGPDVELEVTGHTIPCSRMDEAYPGLLNALAPDGSGWPAGVTCRVIRGGVINLGNEVRHSRQ